MRVSQNLHPSVAVRRVTTAVVAALAALTLTLPIPAQAEPTAVSFSSDGAGYGGVYDGRAAGSYIFDVEGTSVTAFCVEMTKDLNRNANFTAVPLSEAGISGIGQAAWIGANHSSVGTPLDPAAAEAAAVQVAIWMHTDGITLDETNLPNAAIRNRAEELAAAAGNVASTPTSFQLTVTGAVAEDGESATFTAVAATDSGTPIEGVNVVFSTGETVTTNGDGEASVEVETSAGEEVTVTADATFAILAGYALVPDDGSQTLVAVNPATVSRSGEATVNVPEATTTTTTVDEEEEDEETTTTTTVDEEEDDTTTTTTTPTTTTTDGDGTTTTQDLPDELPHTGGNSALWWLAIAGVGGLGSLYLIRRSAAQED